MSTTLSTLMTRLNQKIGDYISETVTTALTTDTNVVCTTLANYVNRDDVFNRDWIRILDYANAGEIRKISDYATSTTTATVLGANWTSDTTNKATFEITKYNPNNAIRAINIAARKIWPNLFRTIRDVTLTTGNILPNPSFEDWTSSSYPDYWTTLSNATSSESTTAGTTRGSGSSCKVTASSDNGYIELNSDTYPKLLDLMGQTVSLYAWCLPQTADDGTITIYTKQADATAQTLTSTTSNPAGEFTLLTLEDQVLNDDLVEVRIRLSVATSGQYAYFDNVRLTGLNNVEYVLPLDFQNQISMVDRVSISYTNLQTYAQDDLLSTDIFEPVFYWRVEDDGETRYLLTDTYNQDFILKIEGRAPLESNLTTSSSTMTIEDPFIDLLTELAASELFSIEAGLPSAGDRDFLRSESYRYLSNYEYMKKTLKKKKPQTMQRFRF